MKNLLSMSALEIATKNPLSLGHEMYAVDALKLMNENQRNFLEDFKAAIRSTCKSVSRQSDIEVIFDNNQSENVNKIISLPNIEFVESKLM